MDLTTRKNPFSYRCLISISLALVAGLTAIAGLAGCGGRTSVDCTTATALSISPASATADHAAAAPGDQMVFVGFDDLSTRPPACGPVNILQAQRQDLKWTVSDPANVTIGNTLNVDYGKATCVNATAAPVTVTASGLNTKGATITGTSTLSCK